MDKVILKQSCLGRGVYACEDVPAGESILDFSGPRVSWAQIPAPHGPENDYYLQIDDDVFLGPSGKVDDFVNHSCDPNAGVRISGDHVGLIAIRDIPAGEEVCFDYSTVMGGYPWEMPCACRSSICRGSIGDFLRLPLALQERYVRLGIVPDFILWKYNQNQRHVQSAILMSYAMDAAEMDS